MGDYERASREQRRQTEALEDLAGPVGLRNGAQCKNWAIDQSQIIALLNKIPIANGGALHPTGPTNFRAPRDGYCDPSLSQLIRKFQQANSLGADGVADPGGPTIKLLKKMAAGGVPQQPNVPAQEIEDYFNKVHTLIVLLDAILRRPGLPAIGFPEAELRRIKMDLERLLAQSGVKTRPDPVATRNYAGAVAIGAIIIAIFAALVVMTMPKYREAAGVTFRTAYHETAIRVEEAKRRLSEFWAWASQKLAQGVIAIEREAHRIVTKNGICKFEFDRFSAKSTELTSFLFRFANPSQELLFQRLTAWIDLLMSLLRCLGVDGHPLYIMLQTLTQVIKLILGSGWEPPPFAFLGQRR